MKRMNKAVLLATNSLLTREVPVGSLEERGYAVVVEWGIREAAGACSGNRPDLLLVDLDWPEDAGWKGWGLIREGHHVPDGCQADDQAEEMLIVQAEGL